MSTSLSDQAYQQIQKKLLDGELRAGHIVSEELLAKELGMSRTPVRDAIRRLRVEGFVEQIPKRGTIVRTLDRQELEELYEVRMALESHAVARAAGQLTDADLDVLDRLCQEAEAIEETLRDSGESLLDSKDLPRLLAADMAFHMVLLRASGNHRVMKIIGESRMLTRMFDGYSEVHQNLDVISRANRFHRKILAAVKQGQENEARKLMMEHISVGKSDALNVWDNKQQQPLSRPSLEMPDDLLAELKDIELSWDD